MKLIKNLAVLITASAISVSTIAADFSNIYIFGDSMLDTGNAAAFVGDGTVAKRFSNGPVTSDYITEHYGFTAEPSLFLLGGEYGNNYAVGGALAIDADGDESTPDTNLPTQVNSFLQFHGGSIDSDALYVVGIGGNDVFNAINRTSDFVGLFKPKSERKAAKSEGKQIARDAAFATKQSLEKLLASGAKEVMVLNAPNLRVVPGLDSLVDLLRLTTLDIYRANKMWEKAEMLSQLYNSELLSHVDDLETTYGIDIKVWDLYGFINEVTYNGSNYGFNNTNDACVNVLTGNQASSDCGGYVFFDVVHPTNATTQIAAPTMIELIEK